MLTAFDIAFEFSAFQILRHERFLEEIFNVF